jgi:hypothetical protein
MASISASSSRRSSHQSKNCFTARVGHAGVGVGGAGGREFDEAATGHVVDDNLLCGPFVEVR